MSLIELELRSLSLLLHRFIDRSVHGLSVFLRVCSVASIGLLSDGNRQELIAADP